ncbi:MAG: phospholipase [Rhodocyclaceae bacterium]|nr:phospholipase [Rhodocyclaceae bacterium]
MKIKCSLLALFILASTHALAWGNHTPPSYRALENMPEVANATPVKVESLDAFLKAEEQGIAALMAKQEIWARANVDAYAARPTALDYKANPNYTDAARRLAFFKALRIAQDSRFALYIHPDARAGEITVPLLPYSTVHTLPEPPVVSERFIAINPGDTVSVLQVVASASSEPDYGLDINLFEDNPGEWGKTYGFGTLSFGNPAYTYSSQAPFHMGFFHESSVIYKAGPFLKRTFPLLRAHQYSTLAVLAFKTGHPYWGWRFTGLALHYIQDLTQPYHARLSPGESTPRVISANVLAMIGLPSMKQNIIVLLGNRHMALEQYQSQIVRNAAKAKADTAAVLALRNGSKDASYPPWSDSYIKEVLTAQSATYADRVAGILIATLPGEFVNDPTQTFGSNGDVDVVGAISKVDAAQRAELDIAIAEMLGNYGAHSRNLIRGIQKLVKTP